MEERRKSKRFHVPFTVEVIPSSETDAYVTGEVRDFSPEGFSFEADNVQLGTNMTIIARFAVNSDQDYINVRGRIVWKIQIGSECQVGVEINEIDTDIEDDLGYPFTMWNDKMKDN